MFDNSGKGDPYLGYTYQYCFFCSMKDIQKLKDKRGLRLDRVGITKLSLSLLIPCKKNTQQVTATVNFFADLHHASKGHHMSRFVEILFRNRGKHLTFENLKAIASEAKKELQAEDAYLEISFIYFMQKESPVSKKMSFADYECKIYSRVNSGDSEQRIVVKVPVMLLCPCSKAISKYNAHSQRAFITVDALVEGNVLIDELIKLIEKNGSCEIYSVLKRPDEKYVTEKSYENPKFVEDVVRDTVLAIRKNKKIHLFIVECESYESIHNHNAYARYSSIEDNRISKNVYS